MANMPPFANHPLHPHPLLPKAPVQCSPGAHSSAWGLPGAGSMRSARLLSQLIAGTLRVKVSTHPGCAGVGEQRFSVEVG